MTHEHNCSPKVTSGITHIDLGSGDGQVLSYLQNALNSEPFCTEVSSSMKKRLSASGYRLLEHDKWAVSKRYSIISMLNLLDRCHNAHEMLFQAADSLTESGYLIISSVFPIMQRVEYLPNKKQFQKIPVTLRA